MRKKDDDRALARANRKRIRKGKNVIDRDGRAVSFREAATRISGIPGTGALREKGGSR